MGKEQSEKAKKILNHIKGYGVYDGNDDIEIFEWLIEQAERVQELETRIDNFYKLNMKLYKQNKRYREALEYLLFEVNEMDEPHEALTDFLVQALEEGMTIN